MKKIIITLIAMLLLSSVALAKMSVFDESNNKLGYDVEIQLREGWNLIPAVCNTGKPDIQAANIKTLFFFNPHTDVYFNFYHEGKFQNEAEIAPEEEYYCSSSWWALVTEPTTFKYKTDHMQKTENRVLKDGWNFIVITPDFEAKSFNQMVGECDFTKIYHFETGPQQWFDLTNDESLDESFHESAIGSGLLVKVSNSCTMGSAESDDISAPPAIPQ